MKNTIYNFGISSLMLCLITSASCNTQESHQGCGVDVDYDNIDWIQARINNESVQQILHVFEDTTPLGYLVMRGPRELKK